MALVERDTVTHVPAVTVDDDLLVAFLSRQDRREHDAVVVDPGLGVEDGDLVTAWGLLQDVLEHAPGGHAVADDDEFFGHGCISRGPKTKAAIQAPAARARGHKDLIGGITDGRPPLDTRSLA